MKKGIIAMVLAFTLCLGLLSGNSRRAFADNTNPTEEETQATRVTSLTAVDESFADDRWKLILNQPSQFHRMTYTDQETGLYVHYTIYLPAKYDAEASYPLVVFLADSDSTGTDPLLPLSQGIGGLVWTAPEWQEVFPAIVAVPLYREEILDHNHGHTTTGYVELTKNFVDYLGQQYAVDQNRIYGTGQGMGCEALMAIAAENPKLFTVCMFVGGQWDIDELAGLAEQKFIYFAAEDDIEVANCARELMNRFSTDGVGYAYSIWDGGWDATDRTLAGIKLTISETGHYFVLWKSGTIVPTSDDVKRLTDKNDGLAAVHVASFEHAYQCVAVMEWMFRQNKQEVALR